MKNYNLLIILFILLIHYINCSSALIETKEQNSLNASENKEKSSYKGYEGNIYLITIPNQQLNSKANQAKYIYNKFILEFDSDNITITKKLNSKIILKRFKMENLQKINKIPIYRKASSKDEEDKCFELVFNSIPDSGENNPKNNILEVSNLTFCAEDKIAKKKFITEMIKSKQCQLKSNFKKTESLISDHTKINELLKEKKISISEQQKILSYSTAEGAGCCPKTSDEDKKKEREISKKLNEIKDLIKKSELQKQQNMRVIKNQIIKSKKDSQDLIKRDELIKDIIRKREQMDQKLKNVMSRNKRKDEQINLLKNITAIIKNFQYKKIKDIKDSFGNIIKDANENQINENVKILKLLKNINKNSQKIDYTQCIASDKDINLKTSNNPFDEYFGKICDKITLGNKNLNLTYAAECQKKEKFCEVCCNHFIKEPKDKDIQKKCHKKCSDSIREKNLEASAKRIIKEYKTNIVNFNKENKNKTAVNSALDLNKVISEYKKTVKNSKKIRDFISRLYGFQKNILNDKKLPKNEIFSLIKDTYNNTLVNKSNIEEYLKEFKKANKGKSTEKFNLIYKLMKEYKSKNDPKRQTIQNDSKKKEMNISPKGKNIIHNLLKEYKKDKKRKKIFSNKIDKMLNKTGKYVKKCDEKLNLTKLLNLTKSQKNYFEGKIEKRNQTMKEKKQLMKNIKKDLKKNITIEKLFNLLKVLKQIAKKKAQENKKKTLRTIKEYLPHLFPKKKKKIKYNFNFTRSKGKKHKSKKISKGDKILKKFLPEYFKKNVIKKKSIKSKQDMKKSKKNKEIIKELLKQGKYDNNIKNEKKNVKKSKNFDNLKIEHKIDSIIENFSNKTFIKSVKKEVLKKIKKLINQKKFNLTKIKDPFKREKLEKILQNIEYDCSKDFYKYQNIISGPNEKSKDFIYMIQNLKRTNTTQIILADCDTDDLNLLKPISMDENSDDKIIKKSEILKKLLHKKIKDHRNVTLNCKNITSAIHHSISGPDDKTGDVYYQLMNNKNISIIGKIKKFVRFYFQTSCDDEVTNIKKKFDISKLTSKFFNNTRENCTHKDLIKRIINGPAEVTDDYIMDEKGQILNSEGLKKKIRQIRNKCKDVISGKKSIKKIRSKIIKNIDKFKIHKFKKGDKVYIQMIKDDRKGKVKILKNLPFSALNELYKIKSGKLTKNQFLSLAGKILKSYIKVMKKKAIAKLLKNKGEKKILKIKYDTNHTVKNKTGIEKEKKKLKKKEKIYEKIMKKLSGELKRNIKRQIKRNVKKNVKRNVEQNIIRNVKQKIKRNVKKNVKQIVKKNVKKNVKRNIEKNGKQIVKRKIKNNLYNNNKNELLKNITATKKTYKVSSKNKKYKFSGKDKIKFNLTKKYVERHKFNKIVKKKIKKEIKSLSGLMFRNFIKFNIKKLTKKSVRDMAYIIFKKVNNGKGIIRLEEMKKLASKTYDEIKKIASQAESIKKYQTEEIEFDKKNERNRKDEKDNIIKTVEKNEREDNENNEKNNKYEKTVQNTQNDQNSDSKNDDRRRVNDMKNGTNIQKLSQIIIKKEIEKKKKICSDIGRNKAKVISGPDTNSYEIVHHKNNTIILQGNPQLEEEIKRIKRIFMRKLNKNEKISQQIYERTNQKVFGLIKKKNTATLKNSCSDIINKTGEGIKINDRKIKISKKIKLLCYKKDKKGSPMKLRNLNSIKNIKIKAICKKFISIYKPLTQINSSEDCSKNIKVKLSKPISGPLNNAKDLKIEDVKIVIKKLKNLDIKLKKCQKINCSRKKIKYFKQIKGFLAKILESCFEIGLREILEARKRQIFNNKITEKSHDFVYIEDFSQKNYIKTSSSCLNITEDDLPRVINGPNEKNEDYALGNNLENFLKFNFLKNFKNCDEKIITMSEKEIQENQKIRQMLKEYCPDNQNCDNKTPQDKALNGVPDFSEEIIRTKEIIRKEKKYVKLCSTKTERKLFKFSKINYYQEKNSNKTTNGPTYKSKDLIINPVSKKISLLDESKRKKVCKKLRNELRILKQKKIKYRKISEKCNDIVGKSAEDNEEKENTATGSIIELQREISKGDKERKNKFILRKNQSFSKNVEKSSLNDQEIKRKCQELNGKTKYYSKKDNKINNGPDENSDDIVLSDENTKFLNKCKTLGYL